jgi:acetone carboxylase gamma subunit
MSSTNQPRPAPADGAAWDRAVLRDMLDGKLDSETLRRIQRAPKEADRFDRIVALEQERVPWTDRILLPLQEHLFVVEQSAGQRIVKCECGQELGDYRQNWKLSALVYERDSADGEVFSAEHSFDSEWMILREFYCPGCGAQLEVEAVPPAHPLIFSALPDIDGFEARRQAGS